MSSTPGDPATIAVIGAGNRGADVYAHHLSAAPDEVRIAAVADPDPVRRDALADRHAVPLDARFADWHELLARPRLADAVVIATPDALHVEPAREALARGYHLLLEKPIAPTLREVRELQQAAREARGRVTVAHVLRYGPFFSRIKRLLGDGAVGDLVSVQHTENIGFWHYAHSYVRGNWRRQDQASPMILAKACHDLDLLRWLVGRPCRAVASYGGLRHFRREHAPEGSTDRCTGGCAVERTCPYSAIRIYLEAFGGGPGWPNSVLVPDPSPQRVRRALEQGPYGRCVYRSDNDVADHQVVAMEFDEGVSATLTVSAFTWEETRTIHLMGTHGELRGHMSRGEIEWNDFSRARREVVRVDAGEQGHGGADEALVRDFVARLRGRATGPAVTDLEASVESHLMAFAAERSRHDGRSVRLADLA